VKSGAVVDDPVVQTTHNDQVLKMLLKKAVKGELKHDLSTILSVLLSQASFFDATELSFSPLRSKTRGQFRPPF